MAETYTNNLNDFQGSIFWSLPTDLQDNVRRTIGPLLDEIKAASPGQLAPERVLLELLVHLQPGAASEVLVPQGMNSYNSYKHLLALGMVEKGKNIHFLS